MFGYQAVISDIAKCSHADMPNGHPAFQFVVARAVKDVGDSDRSHGSGGFQTGEGGVVVNHLGRQQNLFPATGLHVPSRGVIEAAENRHA